MKTRSALAALLLSPLAATAQTPGFDCAKARSAPLQAICASRELSGLDRDLNELYTTVRHQGGIDATPLAAQIERDETRWRLERRDPCGADTACLRWAYRDRLAELRDQSLQAANPAAFAETRPYAAPAPAWAAARALVGQACRFAINPLPGFELAGNGFPPIVQFPGAVVATLHRDGALFAFLYRITDTEPVRCEVQDVVALPPAQARVKGPQIYACNGGDVSLLGFGVGASERKLTAFWRVDAAQGRLWRQSTRGLGGLMCSQPESGD
jgi:uncharacterized protein